MEKVERIRNPLTLIAIFAGLSEVAMTAVLPSLPPENQRIFMWFVIIYPLLLVCGFFYILIWRREVLYAPSDFKDDATWLAVMRDKERKILEKYPVETAITSQSQMINTETRSVIKKPFEENRFYEFLRSLGLTHDNIEYITSNVDKVEELPDFVTKQESIKNVSENIKRVITEFHTSKDDYNSLKSMIGGTN